MRIEVEKKLRVRREAVFSRAAEREEYCVPLTGSCKRRRSCCKSSSSQRKFDFRGFDDQEIRALIAEKEVLVAARTS